MTAPVDSRRCFYYLTQRGRGLAEDVIVVISDSDNYYVLLREPSATQREEKDTSAWKKDLREPSATQREEKDTSAWKKDLREPSATQREEKRHLGMEERPPRALCHSA